MYLIWNTMSTGLQDNTPDQENMDAMQVAHGIIDNGW